MNKKLGEQQLTDFDGWLAKTDILQENMALKAHFR